MLYLSADLTHHYIRVLPTPGHGQSFLLFLGINPRPLFKFFFLPSTLLKAKYMETNAIKINRPA